MRIFLTNDDGIGSDGLKRLAEAAGKLGEVWIVAPDGERSAASHSITLRSHIDVWPVSYPLRDVRAFACSGTPADCVRVGLLSVLPSKPDLVLTGINYGYNTASDIMYSATVGAAMEARFQGCHAIALSEGASPVHEVTDVYLPEILAELTRRDPGHGRIYNVNFPSCPLSACKGIRRDCAISSHGFYEDRYREVEALPGGGSRLKVDGLYKEEAEEGTDLRAVIDKYVSVSEVKSVYYR